jgi:dTDP-4-dehydrorhamnose reductase
MTMRVLILGGAGMLGRAVAAAARRRGEPALALSRRQADVTDPARLRYWLEAFSPDVVVNCAAYTKVDRCEGEGREEAWAVNGRAVGTVGEETARAGARLVQVSTDYVFDGQASAPYGEEAATAPLQVYGESKLEGERRALGFDHALVVRASWLFGPGGPNFAATIAGLIDRGERPLEVVADQQGAPTYTPFLAAALLDLAAGGASGIVHYRNHPPASWYAFASEIARIWRGGGRRGGRCAQGVPGPPGWSAAVEVVPIATAEHPRPARRPAYSVLAVERCEALLGRAVEPWLGGLAEYFAGRREGRS